MGKYKWAIIATAIVVTVIVLWLAPTPTAPPAPPLIIPHQSTATVVPSQLHQEHLTCDEAWQKYLVNPTDENDAAQRKLCDGK